MKNKLLSKLAFTVLFVFIATLVNAQQTDKEIWQQNLDKGLTLYKNEDYQTALPYLEASYAIAEKIYTINDWQLEGSVHLLGSVYYELKLNDKALPLMQLDLQITEKTLGKDHATYGIRLNNLGQLYKDIGDYQKALPLFLEALENAEKTLGKNHATYGTRLNNLASLYQDMGDYQKALPLLLEALENTEKTLGKKHPEYGTCLNNLAYVYGQIGDYQKALTLLLASLENTEKNLGKNHPNYGTRLNNLAYVYGKIGDYQKALPLFLESLKNTEKTLGKNHPEYGARLNNLATLYKDMGDYQKALPLFLEALENAEKTLGKDHATYGIRLNNLAYVYEEIGDYQKALPLYLEALENKEKSLGKNHPEYGASLNNLAVLYQYMGDYQKALPLYLEALENKEKTLGKNHATYGLSLNNLAILYTAMGDFQKALPLLLASLENAEKTLGKNHRDYGISLCNLALLYQDMGDYQKAMPIYLEALENTEKALGKNHLVYGLQLNNLATLYIHMGDYQKALTLCLEALENGENTLGKNHPDYGIRLNSVAACFYGMGDYQKALPYTLESNQNLLSQIENIFKFRSEKEKKVFLETTVDSFDFYQSIGINKDNPLTEFTEMNMNNQLVLKGLLLNSSKDILGKLEAINDKVVIEKMNTFRSLKSQLAFQYSLPIDKRIKNIDNLSVAVNNAETELVKEYNARFPNSRQLKKDWKEIQTKLKKDEVAIEFSHFQYRNKKQLTDSIFYAAYVVKKEWKQPKVVYLFEKQQLTNLLGKKTPDDLYASRNAIGIKSNSAVVYRDSIYSLVWKPLEQYVVGAKTIYYAPDGLLNQLPFAALAPKEGKLLSEQFNLVQLSSTGNIIDAQKEPRTDSALLIGGINYDFDPTNKQEISENQLSYLDLARRGNSKGSRSAGETWNYLAGTKKETEDIKLVYNSNKKTYQSLSGTAATEENFKKLSGKSPTVLHIATHGFFFENSKTKKREAFQGEKENQYKLAEDPMLRSGLILAGANYAWKNGSNPYAKEDGILTALEISNLDLSNTDLVVLSACETGLGDMDNSEGVYGLQRAFKMAGVRYIIMSLWQVPDAETAEFMKLFYSNWLGGKDVRTAFNETQKTMKNKYANEPVKWAAFVLFE